jgi:Spy/CpxP family protein refolding chaperone
MTAIVQEKLTMSVFRTVARFTLAAVVIGLLCAPTLAQPGGGGFGGRGGFGGPGGGVTGLLMSDQIREEIEITDDQLADLEAMGEEMRDQMRSMFEGMRDLSPDERRERFATMRDDMQDIQSQAEDRMNEILLPHQVARLREINLQQQVRRGGLEGALQGELAEELGITDEQREQMVAKAQELQQEMQQKIEQLRKDAQDELMSLLTPDQRSKLDSLMGTDFEMEDRGFGGRFGGRGGRDRGGRGRPGDDQ